ncbi:MAG: tetratricopeptide repeat protein [Pseudomonadota bacterium]
MSAATVLTLAACSLSGGLGASEGDGVTAPGVDLRGDAVSGAEVGHRLVAAGEYELALKAFNRAALADGMNAEILSGMGTANLGLGRLGQAEVALRRATTEFEAWPEVYNNLGVVLMEQGKTAEAVQIFRKAFALDDGESTHIRDNLRLALAKSENSATAYPQDSGYALVRRGSSDYLLRPAI